MDRARSTDSAWEESVDTLPGDGYHYGYQERYALHRIANSVLPRSDPYVSPA